LRQPFIQFSQVSKTYVTKDGETKALDHIDFTVEKGEFISLVGPSGCGKTTILSLLAGLIPPTSGTITIDGKPVSGPTRQIGYMLQQDYLLTWRTIEKNIQFGLEIQKSLTPSSLAYAYELLEEMGLTRFKKHYPNQLSGGMRQRVALVRTLATNPDILLLDEPFSALDYQTKLKLEDLVVDTLRKKGKTAILVTHDITEAIAMSDRIIVLSMAPGRIKAVVDIPMELREPLPFQSREVPLFREYFLKVWKEIEE